MTNEPTALPTAEELSAALPAKVRLWVDLYISNGMNATQASRDAKYADRREGYRILRRKGVQEYLQARLNEEGFTPAEIMRRLAYQAEGSMADFLTVAPTERSYWVRADQAELVQEAAKRRGVTPDALDNFDVSGIMGGENVAQTEDGVLMVCIKRLDAEVSVDWRGAEQAQALGRVKKIKIGKDGSTEFELHDPVRALELLGKHHKLFTDKVETSGPNGGPVEVQITRRIVDGPE